MRRAFQITAPGTYLLGGGNAGLNYAPSSANDSIIKISSSGVILDLGGHTLKQSNFVAGLSGVVIDPNLSNIIVRNGYIKNITGAGICIGAGCSVINIENIVTMSCDTRAISCIGAHTNLINNLTIRNCTLTGCCQGALADYVVSLSECVHTQIIDCNATCNGLPSLSALSGLHLFNVASSRFSGINISRQQASSTLRCIDASGVTDAMFVDCKIKNSLIGNNGTVIGIDLLGSCTNVMFQQCYCLSVTSNGTSATTIGFRVQAGNDEVSYRQCAVANMVGDGTLYGFYTSGNRTSYSECIAKRAAAGSGSAIAFELNQAKNSKVSRCTIEDYSSTSGIAVGIDIQGFGTTVGGIGLVNNIIGFCVDSTAAGGYAIRTTNAGTAPTDLFTIQNIAYRTGTSASSLFANVNTNSVQTNNLSALLNGGMNGVLVSPWTSIGITTN